MPLKFTPTHLTIIIVAFLTMIAVLVFAGKETGALIAVGTAVLGGIGVSLGQQQVLKNQTNGNTSQLTQIVADNTKALTEQARMTSSLLALMMPGSPMAEAKVFEIATAAATPILETQPTEGT